MQPTPPASAGGRFRFGLFGFDNASLELEKNGRPVSIRPQPLKVLALLLSRPGELISRDSLHQALWDGDTFVDFEQGLNHAVRELRLALGDASGSPRFIQTLPKRGYRFIAPVERAPDVDPPAARPAAIPAAPIAAVAPPPTTTGTLVTTASPGQAGTRVSGRRIAALAAVTMLIGIVVALLVLRRSEPPTPYALRSLAVQSFASPNDPALGVGLAAAISARLGGQQGVSVRASTAGASHVLSGEIMILGSDIKVLARVQDVERGVTIWSDRVQVRADRLFSVEDVIADRVTAALRLQLAAAEQDRLRRRYTSNDDAYRDYLRGRASLVKYTPEGTRTAIASFEQALQRDPGYALARAGLAMASADMYLRFAPADEVERWGERAEAEARAALALDSDLAEAHLARAAVARKREFDWHATVTTARRALVLNPNLEQARFFIAAAYYHHGYMDEALIEMEKGQDLHGADVIEPIRIGALVALFSGNFAPARARLEEVSRLSSQAIGDTYLALASVYSGSADRGLAMLRSLAYHRSASTAARASAALAAVLASQHDATAARQHIGRVLKGAYRDHHVAYTLGAAYAQLGDFDEAERWLRTAADTGFPCLTFFERDPLLEPLRRRAEFTTLLAHVRARREASLSPADQ
jgi:DNA-binding winged helix-turn-helix (wHTH) protein/tetratricopeptide (TPR) repeat protein